MRVLGANLYAHRRARRKTRHDVAADLGITPPVLRQYEVVPGLDAYLLPIVKLARYYSTTIEDLLTDPDPNIPPMPEKSRRRQKKNS